MELEIQVEMTALGILNIRPLADYSTMMTSLLQKCALVAVVVCFKLKHTMMQQEMDAAGMTAVHHPVVFTMTMISRQREIANNAHQKLPQKHAQLAGMPITPLVTAEMTVAIGTLERSTLAALSMLLMFSQLQNSAAHASIAHPTTQLTSVISQEHPKPNSPHFSYKG